jgi:hypothetical protein
MAAHRLNGGTASGRRARSPAIGIAIGERSVTAVTRAGGSTDTVIEPVDFANGMPGAEALAAAFGRLARRLAERLGRDTAGARISVALLPPLSDARVIRLPPLKRAEAESVIRRDAARHFVGGGAPRVISVIRAGDGGAERPGASFFAAAASVALVEAVTAAARVVGWKLDTLAPAHGAWLAAAAGGRPLRPCSVIAVDGNAVHVIRIERGLCTAIRRAPEGLPAVLLETLGGTPGEAVLLADASERERIAQLLLANGWQVDRAPPATGAEAAAMAAARSPIEFVPQGVAAQRVLRARRNTLRAAAGAAILLAAAAGLELWGLERELKSVQAERAAIREQVAPLLATRDSIDRMGEHTRTVRSLETASPRWTRALFDLALLLPRDAHITSLLTTGDTLVVETTGVRAGAALQALRRAGSLADIRLVGTVERDLEDGATTSERFTFSARLKPPVDRASGRGPSPAPDRSTEDEGARP